MVAAENSNVPEAPAPVPVAVAVTVEPTASEPESPHERHVAGGVGGDIHQTDHMSGPRRNRKDRRQWWRRDNAVGFVSDAVQAALDYSCVIRKGKDGVILELVWAVIAISGIVGRHTNPLSWGPMRLMPKWSLE